MFFQHKKDKKRPHRSNLFLGNLEEKRVKAPSPAPEAKNTEEKESPSVRRRPVRDLPGAPKPEKETEAEQQEPPPATEPPKSPPEPEREQNGDEFFPAETQSRRVAPTAAESLLNEEEEKKAAETASHLFDDAIPGDAEVDGEEAPAKPFGATAFVKAFEEQSAAVKPKKIRRARREMKREEKKAVAALSRTGSLREYISGDEEKKPKAPAENSVAAELEEMYGAPITSGKKKKLSALDKLRYGILFLCIFGFLTAGYFVFDKLYEYYRGSALYKGLADLVSTPDRFADDYLTRSLPLSHALTIEDVYNGRSASAISGTDADAAQRDLIAKIGRLKEINPDTAGWITVENTVINYPVVWSKTRNYYLHRDFYGKILSGGSIFMDERNSQNIAENRNTVLYGHNMADGSMFASLHDFATASVFYNAEIRIATTDGIYVYKPFSVHRSDAYDNYFETDFASDRDYESFLAEMRFISMFDTELDLNRNSQILTLSTCVSNTISNNDRFVVHGVLVDVIR